MKIVVIDGQGGSIGKAIVEQLVKKVDIESIFCIGTNSVATANMLKAGAKHGASGENPVVVACRDADYIIGPIGIIMADSMLGEISPLMAQAVGASNAHKILIPINKCLTVAGVQNLTLSDYIKIAVDSIQV
jgi:NAD(P)-dependent dehydrogenase (short-subunit alcohol dehydrogenase family)